jgi:1,4-alpha-glucan branching enzyme
MKPAKDKKSPENQPDIKTNITLLTEDDLYLFNEGKHFRLYDKLGAHFLNAGKESGVYFAVWAPNAENVAVVGDFNGWDYTRHSLKPREQSGIWEGYIIGLKPGDLYKYHIVSKYQHYHVDKADPLAFTNETPPRTASRITKLDYIWQDADWLENRATHNSLKSPMSIYEVHLGSWRRVPEEYNRFLTYHETAVKLADYALERGFTHIELLPIMEHPFYGSWGYQVTGYFSPTSRYGTPEDFMFMVDYLHQKGIGVILDWVPSHFPDDRHGLSFFDGTHLYEHADPKQGLHPDWNSLIFNYGRNEVRSFLISSGLFWLDKYHIDGLRVDAVASMLYLDYSRTQGEWTPNQHGGHENLEAISFLQTFNQAVYANFPDVQTFAEESTFWPQVSRPVNAGGLGFGLKWDMGWMHDSLDYFSKDPLFRKYVHNKLTFRRMYDFSENFLLPLSHDEVVHGKSSLIAKMPGNDEQKFANLRLLLGYMYALPGKKLLFMGDEFAQTREWDHDNSLQWDLLQYSPHQSVQKWFDDLNRVYRTEPALYVKDYQSDGFQWIDVNGVEESTLSFLRKSDRSEDTILAVFNFTPVVRFNHKAGVPSGGIWLELLNSEAGDYGGSGYGNLGQVQAANIPMHGQPYSLDITLPPLGVIYFKQKAI